MASEIKGKQKTSTSPAMAEDSKDPVSDTLNTASASEPPRFVIIERPHFVINVPLYVPSPSNSEGETSSDEDSDGSFTEKQFNFERNKPPFRIKKRITTKKGEPIVKDIRGKIENKDGQIKEISPQELRRIAKEESQLQQPILDKLHAEGLVGGTYRHASDEKNQLSISFGLNRPRSLSTRKNNLLLKELASDVKSEFVTRRFGFFWEHQWEQVNYKDESKSPENVDYKKVRSFYKQLKKRNPKKARQFRRSQENQPRNGTVPYRAIREALREHENTKELVENARENLAENCRREVYLSLIDSDTQSFRKEGNKGIYAAYTDLYLEHERFPDVMSTGYEYAAESKVNRLIQFASILDRRVRAATAKYVPNGVYYPEPNLCIRVRRNRSTVKENFLELTEKRGDISEKNVTYETPKESPLIIEKVAARPKYEACFSDKDPLLTKTPPRAKNNKRHTPFRSKAELKKDGRFKNWVWKDIIHVTRNTAQSHVKGRDWAINLIRAYKLKKLVRFCCKNGKRVTIRNGKILRNMVISLLSRLFNSYDPISISGGAEEGSEKKFIKVLREYDNYISKNNVPNDDEKTREDGKDIKKAWKIIDSCNTREKIKNQLADLLTNRINKDKTEDRINPDDIENAARESGKVMVDTFREFLYIKGLLRKSYSSSSSSDIKNHSKIKRKISSDNKSAQFPDQRVLRDTKDPLPMSGIAVPLSSSISESTFPAAAMVPCSSSTVTSKVETAPFVQEAMKLEDKTVIQNIASDTDCKIETACSDTTIKSTDLPSISSPSNPPLLGRAQSDTNHSIAKILARSLTAIISSNSSGNSAVPTATLVVAEADPSLSPENLQKMHAELIEQKNIVEKLIDDGESERIPELKEIDQKIEKVLEQMRKLGIAPEDSSSIRIFG